MPIVIPTFSDSPFYTLRVQLDAVTYVLQLRYDVRAPRSAADGTPLAGAWFLTLLDELGETVLLGDLALAVDFPLDLNYPARPWPGFLAACDTSGQGLDAGPDDLGTRVQLVYFSAADLAAAGVA